MARVDVSEFELHVSVDNSNDSYTKVGSAFQVSDTEGIEGESKRRIFGTAAPIIRAGDDTKTGTIRVLYDPADTNGQAVLLAAKRAGTTVYLAKLWDATGGSEEGETFQARITEISEESDAEGDFVERTFTYDGYPSTLTVLSTGLPAS